MTDLSLIETETLISEIFNRFDSFVCFGVQKRTKKNTDTFYRRWGGGDAECIGLADLVKDIIKHDYLKSMESE